MSTRTETHINPSMKQNLEQFTFHQEQSIKDALEKIDSNHAGSIFVLDEDRRVCGLATDGDIRRWLMKDHNIEDSISVCMNRQFVSVREGESREHILKLLDHRVRIIPILSADGLLQNIITRENFPLESEGTILARARSPVRISFGGGGTDLTRYFFNHGGVVINSTIALYSRALLRRRNDAKIVVYSDDLKQSLEADNLEEFCAHEGDFALIVSLVKLISPSFGFELQIGSDFPIGSGLGGSSVVMAAIIGCFNQLRQDKWDRYEMAEMAFQAERLSMDVAGGWQDQYATVFGGFNFMEFSAGENIVHQIRLDDDVISELEESLLLCHTGRSRSSGEIHRNHGAGAGKEQIDFAQLIAESKQLTLQMKSNLLKGQLYDFGRALHAAWLLKKKYSTKITDPQLDQLYDLAYENGALGGKLLGAGGGGYFLFFVPPTEIYTLRRILEDQGYKSQRINFESKGLQTWNVRESRVLKSNG